MDKYNRIEQACRVFKSRKLAVSALDIVKELGDVERCIETLLIACVLSVEEFEWRAAWLPVSSRVSDSHSFICASEALLNCQQLVIHYRSYSVPKTLRKISLPTAFANAKTGTLIHSVTCIKYPALSPLFVLLALCRVSRWQERSI